MNHIKKIIQWCKDNPITVASAAVVLLAGLSFVWPTMAWSSQFQSEVAGRTSDLSKITGLTSTQVTVPPPEADGEPITESTTVNDKRIEALKGFYDNIEGEYEGVRQFVVSFNQFGSKERPNEHKPMTEGLFPDPGNNYNAPFQAQKDYVRAIKELYAALDAGDTMSDKEVDDLIAKERDRYERGVFLGPNAQLTDAQIAEGNRVVAEKVQRIIKERALEHHIYAPAVDLQLQGRAKEEEQRPGPFQVDGWVFQGGSLKLEPMWESQMQLWIQQDLVQALRIANDIDDPNASVIDQPVKVLKEIRVVPGYIGVTNQATGRSSASPMGGEESSGPTVLDETAKDAALKEGLKPDPTYITGRKSNALYDVRHAQMNVIVDYTRLPELLNAIAQVNFMTVIDMQMQDVNEYDMFREGYFFGDGVDAVELWLTIETIWMRDWTAGTYMSADEIREAEARGEKISKGLMPDAVRLRLNLPLRGTVDAALAQQEESGAGGARPGRSTGGFGAGGGPSGFGR